MIVFRILARDHRCIIKGDIFECRKRENSEDKRQEWYRLISARLKLTSTIRCERRTERAELGFVEKEEVIGEEGGGGTLVR